MYTVKKIFLKLPGLFELFRVLLVLVLSSLLFPFSLYFVHTALVDGHHMLSPFLTLKMALKTLDRERGMLHRYLSKG